MNPTEKQIKTEHFQNIVAIAYADGHLDISEAKFLAERAEDYGIPKETVDKIIDNAEKLQFVIPMNNDEREEQLSDAVYMAMIDGNVDEKEYDLCLKIAKKLDLEKDYLDEVIDLTKRLWDKS